MSEPMVSHDCVAFWLLSEEVARARARSCSPARAPTRCSAATRWYPPLPEADGDGLEHLRRRVLRPRPRRRSSACWATVAPDEDASLAFAAEHVRAPGRRRRRSTARCGSTAEVMLVDDPVKRVDNMTMAHGLEARTPFLDHELVELAAACPPELKLADGGKGVLKDAARGVVPDAVIDRPKGYFPVPALSHLEGPVLELVREALHAPAARDRGALPPGVGRRHARRPQRSTARTSTAPRCGSSACSSCGCRRRASDQFAGRPA